MRIAHTALKKSKIVPLKCIFFLNLTLVPMTQGLHNVVHIVAGPSVIVFTNLLSQVVSLTCWSVQ